MKQLLEWSQKIAALAKTGRFFATSNEDRYHRERYDQLIAIAGEMMAQATDRPAAEVQHMLSRDDGYITPKVDVRAGVFKDGRILLVREISNGLWSVPGGWADVGESPAEAITKEILQEAGYKARVSKLVAVHDQHRRNSPHCFHSYKFFFLCEIISRETKSDTETDEIGFYSLADLPPLSTDRVSKEQIALLFEHYCNQQLPAEVD